MTSVPISIKPAAVAPARDRMLAVLFGVTVFVSASLLFLVQPLIAKGLLPLFGGTPAVWTTSMLFFQAALLGGYGFAHVTLHVLGPRRQRRVQLVVLAVALLALPLARPETAASGEPLVSLLVLLATGVGLPFLALSTASPVLQRWFSVSGHSRASNPYVLYVPSNVGSLAALLAYPFLVEPNLPLDAQRLAWSGLYVVFLVLTAACAISIVPGTAAEGGVASARPDSRVAAEPAAATAARRVRWRERTTWLVLAFIPSSLMLGVTTFVTTDIASAPLLWVIPLALYLFSFVVAFSRYGHTATRVCGLVLPFFSVAAAIDMFGSVGLEVALRVPLHLGLFAVAAILCHGRLAGGRPPAARLTEFYLLLAIGGVAGGVVNAIVAPSLLDAVIEYPLAIGAALFVRSRLQGGAKRRWAIGASAVAAFLVATSPLWLSASGGAWGSPAIVALMSLPLVVVALPIPFGALMTLLLAAGIVLSQPPLLAERNFFGVFRVVEADGEHVLVHGTTIHGRQLWPPQPVPSGVGYYHEHGPLGDIFALPARTAFEEIGIVGLGSGVMAAHVRGGQDVTFYEIDPAIAAVAADDRYFTYLSSTDADVDVRIGDGRLLLTEERRRAFDLLIMDAFSSDSVPTHLLTLEAFQLYFDRLSEGGVLVVHISNRYVDLGPVISAAARELGVAAYERHDAGSESPDPVERRQPSRYLVLARDSATLERLGPAWQPLAPTSRHPWTDAFSDIVSTVDWSGNALR